MNNMKGTNIHEKHGADLSFIIDGCSVSISSSPKGTDDPLKTVREILLSAYRTKQPKGNIAKSFFDAGDRK
ncbi:MAG: hypothetical protein VB064_05455 [Oscillospiraceae bacterium]|nr:hypothetical protein [Oscillospiraceae bacterium]